MTFTAKLIKHTHLWKTWRGRHATGGEVNGVPFRLVSVNEYESGELTADQVVALHGNANVALTAISEPTTKPATAQVFTTIADAVAGSTTTNRPPERPLPRRR